jgi:hypothetical protein
MERLKFILLLPFMFMIWLAMGFHTFIAWIEYGRKRR